MYVCTQARAKQINAKQHKCMPYHTESKHLYRSYTSPPLFPFLMPSALTPREHPMSSQWQKDVREQTQSPDPFTPNTPPKTWRGTPSTSSRRHPWRSREAGWWYGNARCHQLGQNPTLCNQPPPPTKKKEQDKKKGINAEERTPLAHTHTP